MYPVIRLALAMSRARRMGPMQVTAEHRSAHLCLPWDLDVFAEMNNGRVLTLYDLGRFGLGERIGLTAALRRRKWGLAVAGASVRYRRRVTAFARIDMATRVVAWDARFFYIVQSMWVGGDCASQALLRTAVTARGRAIPSAELAAELGIDPTSPEPPDWVAAWIAAEATRPWPPEG
jgi:acyl-CoA thioesterase FadM